MEKFDKEKCSRPAKKFKALGHPVRLWLAMQLLESEHCVQEFVEQADFDFSSISQHLAALREAGVVTDEKRGKQVFYRLHCACIKKFLKCVAENQKKDKCDLD